MLKLALTLFSFLKYCGATKLKEMKSHESDAQKMPSLENYDMFIKYIFLWFWSVFEIFKILQPLAREKSQCSTFINTL